MDHNGVFPNFILIGAMKCGTTSLFAVLEQHPEIGVCSIKEPNYFGSSGRVWADNPEQYRELFQDASGKQAIGEATSTYFYDEPALRRIQQELPPDTRILIILRSPASRAFSHWGHLRYYQQFETLDFEEALAQEDQRTIQDHFRPGTFRYFWGGLYAKKVQTCYELFGRERVHVMILEDIIRSQTTELGKLFGFLGVDATVNLRMQQENVASESAAPVLTSLIVNRPAIIDRGIQLLPAQLRRQIFRLGTAVFHGLLRSRKQDRQKLKPELYQSLIRRYMPDIHALEILLERDLSIWYQDVTSSE